MPTNERTWQSYSYLTLYSLLIFLTIPWLRPFQKFVYAQFGKSAFGYFVLASIAIGSAWAIFYIKQNTNVGVSTKNYLWLAGVTCLYGYFTINLWKCPEEAIHFLEYGVLGYFAFRALSHQIKDVTIYFTASLISLFIGTIDETIQWIVPDRYWDFRDVGLNFLAGALLQLGIWKGIRPGMIVEKIKLQSIIILLITCASCIVLLGLCASNTPSRILLYTEKLPFLSFLRNTDTMMSEYGHKHRDSEIGTFCSRFTNKELRTIDAEEHLNYSQILNSSTGTDYNQFLKIYNTLNSPFLYEMRVHIFRRDRYMSLAEEGGEGSKKKREQITIAFKENLILEKYFGNTLQHTVYLWPKSKMEEMKKEIDLSEPYESPVSSELFTSFSERELWFGIGGALCILLVINYIYSHRARRATEILNLNS